MKLVWMKSLPLQCLSLVAGILNFTESHLWPHPKQVGSTCYVWRVQVTNKTRESPKIWIPKCWPEWSTWCHGEIFEMLRLYHTRFKTHLRLSPYNLLRSNCLMCFSKKVSSQKKYSQSHSACTCTMEKRKVISIDFPFLFFHIFRWWSNLWIWTLYTVSPHQLPSSSLKRLRLSSYYQIESNHITINGSSEDLPKWFSTAIQNLLGTKQLVSPGHLVSIFCA